MKLMLMMAAAAMLGSATTAAAAVIEDFETGAFGTAWTAVDGSGMVTGPAAFRGSYGGTTDRAWYYRTDVNPGVGSVLSAWTRSTDGSGRFYLGFGASSAGASSFVLAFNTSELLFQNNADYGFSDLKTTPFSFTTGQWYRAEVSIGPNVVIGRVYGADGTTQLASLEAHEMMYDTAGGVAVRSFDRVVFDDVGANLPPTIPEPASWALLIAGFGAVGTAMRRGPRRVAA